MGRPAKFDQEALVGAVGRVVADGGPGAVTVRRVAAAAGAPIGSVYHRFATLELLVATAWVDAVRAFQVGYLAALALDDVDDAARSAAVHVPLWAAEHPEFRPAPLEQLASAYYQAWEWLRRDYNDKTHVLSVFACGRGNYSYISRDREWQGRDRASRDR